jgi:hypothetical protein
MTRTLEQRIKERQDRVQREKKLAKLCGLSRTQFVLLRSLADGQLHIYEDIVEDTGIYSGLPSELRARHEGSLGAKGLVEEDEIELDRGKRVATFKITARGKKLLQKAAPKRNEKETDHDAQS